ncbi:probable 4-coumarate--CoA ligase 1 [Sabethes cyaneus]|uniref:probable 4-coumarate--CoA ligase 1 n=1 Tax=Sabethes cyaneus TaxID=53552 RepID=UPI00237D9A10|nr:probable 4-coumarate--CoA ligase 1 [Sabethes cyaneus]
MARYDPTTKTWFGPALPGVLNPEANFGQVVLNLLARTPSKVIQINADSGRELSCAELRLRSVRIALNLTGKLGLRKGDLVSLVCANSDNVVPVVVGCLTIGLGVNPLAPVFNKDDLVHMMRYTKSKVVFCDEDNREVVEEAVSEAIGEGCVKIFVLGKASGRCGSIEELLVPAQGEEKFVPEYLGDSKKLLAVILCSSGTTGPPKGVCLSHAHILEGEVFACELDAGPIFNYSPLFWATGVFAMLTSLYYTRPRVITSQSFTEENLISIIERFKVEDIFTPPSYISVLQIHPKFPTANFSSIKRWTMGGAIVSEELRSCLGARFPNGVAKPVYGSSEIGFITSGTGPFAPGSVGTLANDVSGKIFDENDRRLGPGERGEIRVKYKHRFLGYLNSEEATKNAFDEEGFFKTGDIGYFDEKGFLYVIDRIKDIIKYKNFQISPSDLEAIIEQIDGVKQVCVAGIPVEDRSSDLPTAVIVRTNGSTLTEQQVIDTVDGQVSDHKKLRGGVFFVDQLPTSAAGKVLRRVVKQLVMEKKINV